MVGVVLALLIAVAVIAAILIPKALDAKDKLAASVPLAQSIGMDMTQLGIMMVVNLALGLYTPPVGTTLFITSSLARVKVGQTVRELIPFYLVALAVLALVSYVPASILR